MRPIKLWRLMDRFQNFDASLNAQSEWVSAEEALAHGDEKARAERSSIRRALLEEIKTMEYRPIKTSRPHVTSAGLRAALDRICPEEKP
ncbi:MAG TPA: hypothetical protein VGK43_06565 [Solirubrobacterales bacterium]